MISSLCRSKRVSEGIPARQPTPIPDVQPMAASGSQNNLPSRPARPVPGLPATPRPAAPQSDDTASRSGGPWPPPRDKGLPLGPSQGGVPKVRKDGPAAPRPPPAEERTVRAGTTSRSQSSQRQGMPTNPTTPAAPKVQQVPHPPENTVRFDLGRGPVPPSPFSVVPDTPLPPSKVPVSVRQAAANHV
jgi:hypothetical protein